MVLKAVEIKKDVYWVGAVDHDSRNFHGYITPEGTTYNSYLIVDDKTVLIDTVKNPFKDELLERVSSVVDPSRIDYLVVNHVEMDHSSSSEAVMASAENARVIASDKGRDFLQAHYKGAKEWDIRAVKEGDTLGMGKRTLHFVQATMLHWPDTMFTYSPSDKILFSNDGFGQHLVTSERFCDEVTDRDVLTEAQKYYANILMPFGSLMKKKLEEAGGLDFDVIAPSHGVIFRGKEDIDRIINSTMEWAIGKAQSKAVIAYDTMYSSTEKMARAIEEGLIQEGVNTKVYNLRISDWSEVVKEVLVAKALLIGSSTLNNGPLPTVGGFMTYLKGLRPKGKIGWAFGSYGWGGGAVKAITEDLKAAGIEVIDDGIQTRFVPGEEILKESFDNGVKTAKRIIEEVK